MRTSPALLVVLAIAGCSGPTEPPAGAPVSGDVQDAFLRWPLPPGAEQYGDIDGRHLLEYVVEQVEISRRYRDQGHPKFWGRIIGSSADDESAEWLVDRFEAIGLSDVRVQPFALQPQWRPQSWEVTVVAGDTTLPLDTAQPVYRATGTPPEGLDLEAVYVGLGSEADFAGRDVAGKAVFSFSMLGVADQGALERADTKGAAAIFDVHMLPGNMRYQAYPQNTTVPTLTVGGEDGLAVRDLIADAPSGQAPRVRVTLDVEMVPDLQTSIVWGTHTLRFGPTLESDTGWPEAAACRASRASLVSGLITMAIGRPARDETIRRPAPSLRKGGTDRIGGRMQPRL